MRTGIINGIGTAHLVAIVCLFFLSAIQAANVKIIQIPRSTWANPDAFHIAYQNLTRGGRVLEAMSKHRFRVFYASAAEENPQPEEEAHRRRLATKVNSRRRTMEEKDKKNMKIFIVVSPYYFIQVELDKFIRAYISAADFSIVEMGTENRDTYHISVSGTVPEKSCRKILDYLRNNPKIVWVEEFSKFNSHNHNALKLIYGDQAYLEMVSANMQHSKQIVTVVDTGVDVSHCYWGKQENIAHITFDVSNMAELRLKMQGLAKTATMDKIFAYMRVTFTDGFETISTDFIDMPHGHGTHTSGSAVGASLAHTCAENGNVSITPKDASSIRLFFIDVSNNQVVKESLDIPFSVTPLLELSYLSGSRISSNSWGSADNYYTFTAREYDDFAYKHRDYLLLFSAGNNGARGYGTVGSPCIAKNVVCVGASSNSVHAFDDFSKFSWYSSDYSHSTIPPAHDVEMHAHLYNEENLMEFSSTGPAYDGRIKPDIVTAGAPILSACARCGDKCMCAKQGTSMSCPLVAHVSCRILDYLIQKFEWPHSEPSSALVIALMISSTDVMRGRVVLYAFNMEYTYRAYISEVYPTPFTQPVELNVFQQGFGRLNLKYIFNDEFAFMDQQIIRAYQKPLVFTFRARTDNLQTVVSLVWTDPPGELDNDFAIVNDLNLRVILIKQGQVAAVIHGNMQSVPDSLNTREKIIVDTRAGDVIRIIVSSRGPIIAPFSTNYHQQEFSLVYSSTLSKVESSEECLLWDPEYECISGDQEGLYPCINSRYNTSECLVQKEDICQAGEVYSEKQNMCVCTNHLPCQTNSSDFNFTGPLHISHFLECDPTTRRFSNNCTNSLVTVFTDIRNRTRNALRKIYHSEQSILELNENRQPFSVTVWAVAFSISWVVGIITTFILSKVTLVTTRT